MNKYERTASEIIDLHRHTVDEAREVLRTLVAKKGARHIRLVVGKGLHSARGPVLRNFVKKFLTERGIDFAQSKIKDGGEGALEVFFE